jgi:hypothetical protein
VLNIFVFQIRLNSAAICPVARKVLAAAVVERMDMGGES